MKFTVCSPSRTWKKIRQKVYCNWNQFRSKINRSHDHKLLSVQLFSVVIQIVCAIAWKLGSQYCTDPIQMRSFDRKLRALRIHDNVEKCLNWALQRHLLLLWDNQLGFISYTIVIRCDQPNMLTIVANIHYVLMWWFRFHWTSSFMIISLFLETWSSRLHSCEKCSDIVQNDTCRFR